MGYYSEVAICMAFEDDAKRDAFYETLVLRDDDVGDVIKNRCETDDREPWIKYHNTNLRWYELHPDRQSFEDTILPLVLECGGAWSFMRIGEDSTDVEQDDNESKESNVHAPTDAFLMVRRIEWM